MFPSPVLTARQTRFIDEYLVDANGTQAAIRAGYGAAGARVAAHRLLTNVAISSAIGARQKADATRLWIDRENVLAGLLEAVEMAREQRNPAGMIAGLREIAKLMGFYAPTAAKVDVGLRASAERDRIEAMTDVELFSLIGEISAVTQI
ncbi:Terminase small subunit [Acidovorax sp. NO-1]|uniref:terminase small subunit n=1 Tax=Acidovorax sp. NO-1 TaxID=512030 RepID=UPI00023FCDF3|nr:terminase small subunit [Acidovorax sp. NO-1]EHL24407.1 Terminase small subunit [Acidovorax sp. NO-1]